MNQNDWWPQVKQIQDSWLDFGWQRHIDEVNQLYGLDGDYIFSLPAQDAPPAWFNGDIEHLQPGKWVLVVSLNHAKADHTGELTRANSWPFWRTYNLTHWYPKFFSSWARMGAEILGIDLPPGDDYEKAFATCHMLFIEFCPCASRKFPTESMINWAEWKRLAETDPGPKVTRQIRKIAFDIGEPAAVICNGKKASWDVKDQQFKVHNMKRRRVAHPADPATTVHLYVGTYTPLRGRSFPVLGCQQITWRTRNLSLLKRAIVGLVRQSEGSDFLMWDCPDPWERGRWLTQ